MAPSLAQHADRVFASVMAPLVLGGAMRPGHPFGARTALALLGAGALPSDADLASRVDLARVRVARRLTPVDRVDDPRSAEWALGIALHDLLQVANPRWIRRAGPKRLLDLVRMTLDRVPPPATAAELLSRHTWFSRVLAITRTDTRVSWWTGEREFLGEPPPARLTAWPDLRRVRVTRDARPVTELLSHGGATEDQPAYVEVLARFLQLTPLTDLATAGRGAPSFAWGPETLAVAGEPVSRALALRAASIAEPEAIDAALGAATRALLKASHWAAASIALDFLAHRAIAAASIATTSSVAAIAGAADPAAFAHAAGALVARKWIEDPAYPLPEGERRRLGAALAATTRGPAAREIEAMLGHLA